MRIFYQECAICTFALANVHIAYFLMYLLIHSRAVGKVSGARKCLWLTVDGNTGVKIRVFVL